MKNRWYHYVAAFAAALFLSNTIPHFVKGICGDSFPSPFADPPGKGLSDPLTNMMWALCNLVAGYILLRLSRFSWRDTAMAIVFFLGMAFTGIMLSIHFADKAPM
ncbi:MAG: hypothetical protein IBJ09_10255 [Bacteroidia bacterium]|nr:hypothetical protein [Bacteroidia bacterium]